MNNMNFVCPVFFERNRVARVYTGGKLFADFFGDAPVDGYLPEEWVGSTVRALNEGSTDPTEGISKVKGTDVLFSDLLAKYPDEMLGDRKELDVLVKLLDSSIRLPVQCHPDHAYAKKHFDSEHGKAESWVILATRENACIYFGFKDRISREDFEKAVDASEYDQEAMSAFLNRIPVKAGDVYFIGAGMVHAIGAGCLILEVQEPTDFTIQPERMCGEYRLSDYQMYLGLSRDIALDCFDFSSYGDAAIAKGRKAPVTLRQTEDAHLESLISYDDTPCFSVKRLTVSGKDVAGPDDTAIYVVTDGCGEISWNGQSAPLKKGDYFFIPHALKGQFTFSTDTQMELVICLPSKI